MPGGVINGNKNDSVLFPTLLQIADDALKYWTSLTCLYDRYWTPDPDKVTLPICVFHVTKITPVYSVETTRKRVLLYEPQGDYVLTPEQMANQLRKNTIQSIIDNSVKQPTTYSIEAVVPFQPVGRYVSEGVKVISDMITGFSDLVGNNKFTSGWEDFFGQAFNFLAQANTALGVTGKLPNAQGVNQINMNSLEAMAESCRTLCMKMWTGYEYKYAVITGMTYEKRANEDDVFRASISLQEVPVLSITRPQPSSKHNITRNWAVTATAAAQSALVAPLVALTGVRNASGGVDTGLGIMKKTLFGEA